MKSCLRFPFFEVMDGITLKMDIAVRCKVQLVVIINFVLSENLRASKPEVSCAV